MLIPCLEAPAALHAAEDGGGAGDSPPSAQTNFRKAEQGDLAKAHQVGPGWMSLQMEPVLVTTPPLQNVIAEMRNNLAEARGAKEGGKEAASTSTAEQGPGHSLCF